jgi:hypothetical protein
MKQNYQTFTFLKWIKNYVNKVYLFFILAAGSPGIFYSQMTYTFTNASATGSLGPTQSQINTAYASTNLNGSVVIPTGTPGIQTWTVPSTMGYRIEARGGQGFGTYGGRGAIIAGDFTLTAGTVLKILVGQKAEASSNSSAYNEYGGGGGSFVTNLSNVPYVVAGGGGGSFATSFQANSDGTVSTSGNSGANATDIGAGGTSGNGGTGAAYADGGGGLLSSGGGGFSAPGIAFVSGGTGGSLYGQGGFGGGAGTSSYNDTRGAGGGGYSGGGGAHTAGVGAPQGGGGGSYNNGVNQTNTTGGNTGQGLVIISELCNIRIYSSGSNSVAPSICSGNSLTLTTNAVSNYTWSNGNTTSTMIVVSPTSSQTYSIVGTSSAACVAAGSISVTVSSGLPVLSISNPSSNICLGKAITLTASGAITYTWTGGVVNGVAFPPSATSSYTVTGQNGCGTSTAATGVTISPLVVSSIASPTIVCAGSSTSTLTANSSVNGYTWQPFGYSGQSVVVSPSAYTIYTVTASDGTCSGTSTVAVATKPTPTIGAVTSSSMICANGIVTITATGGLSYSWTPGNLTGPTVTVSPTAPTLYQVIGTNSLGCSGAANAIVLTNPSPTVVISTNHSIICVGGSAGLTASGAVSYNWLGGGPGSAGYTVNPQITSIYTVTGTDANGCTDTEMTTISVFSPSVSVSAVTSSICNGSTTTLTAAGANTYTWNNGLGTSASVHPSPTITTMYIVNASTTSSAVTCPSSNTITVTVFNNPSITIVATKTVMCRKDANAILTAQGGSTYVWSTSAITSTASASSAVATTSLYTVTGTDANGCVNTASIQVKVNTCTGITEQSAEQNSIIIYPNPSNGEFTISSEKDITLKIMDQLGREIRVISLTIVNDHKLQVSDLANGIYFVIGQNGTQKVSQKIVITK